MPSPTRIWTLAHPTAGLDGDRERLEFDFERIVENAVGCDIALGVNASMDRLDLNDLMARAAVEAGALIAIGSDAHSAAQLDLTGYGVFQARWGWIESRSVVNTRRWTELNRWLERRELNQSPDTRETNSPCKSRRG